jgi:hypothetical protein
MGQAKSLHGQNLNMSNSMQAVLLLQQIMELETTLREIRQLLLTLF